MGLQDEALSLSSVLQVKLCPVEALLLQVVAVRAVAVEILPSNVLS